MAAGCQGHSPATLITTMFVPSTTPLDKNPHITWRPRTLYIFSSCLFSVLCMLVFCLSVSVCIACITWCIRSEESSGPGAGVSDGCEAPCGFAESNLGPLKRQSVLSTTKSSLQTLFSCLLLAYSSSCFPENNMIPFFIQNNTHCRICPSPYLRHAPPR